MKSVFQSMHIIQRRNLFSQRLWRTRFLLVINVLLVIIISMLVPLSRGIAAPEAQESTPSPTPPTTTQPVPTESTSTQDQAIIKLSRMTPEERVGQLFLVTFEGDNADLDSKVYELITRYYVGGVVLKADLNNINSGDGSSGVTVQNVISLNRQLQLSKWTSSIQSHINPITNESISPSFVPLFIGLSQEGDGYPYDQILNDMTPLPNAMALGATWNTTLARDVGNVLGTELSAIGVNLLLGPSMDVLEVSQLNGANILGTRSFGGDPYWVGEMGKAYIEGIHQGSDGRMAVIAKHFPGHGGSDRLPEEEVATVRKTLEELISFELAPFFSVTGSAPSPEATTDGLLTSHIRYQGFQGNIRTTTRPVSFDPQALNLLMDLPQLSEWRANGGIMVSDDLGNLAVRRFYDLTNQPFDMPRRVALNAFLAGNDLLYVADFSSGELDSYEAAIQTIEFFAQKYREDLAFAQRVDDSVLRILQLKYKIYRDYSLASVLVSSRAEEFVGTDNEVSFEVARQAATLISPTQIELEETIPDPPNLDDRIVFISDSRTARQCDDCPELEILGVRELEEVVIGRYGPDAGGQVTRNNLISYTLSNLESMLAGEAGDHPIERSLQRANWIVFTLLDNNGETPAYKTLSRFLSERPDLFQQKRLIVFALNAPYFLDATNVSKLTAYYGLYSKPEQFVDMAAYLLFKEQLASGASPVSIPGISYQINLVLYPDPEHVITIELDIPPPEISDADTTPEPAPTPEFKLGDVLPLRTGVIIDHNGNPVPDGTPVKFMASYGGDISPLIQEETTINGIARTTFTLNDAGPVEISAESDPATSDVLRFDVPVSVEEGTTPAPTQQTTVTPTIQPTETPSTALPEISLPLIIPPNTPQILDWGIALLLSIGLAWIAYKLASMNGQARWGVRAGLLVLIGGLLAYSYLALEMPGSSNLIQRSVAQGVILVTLVGAAFGLFITWSWRAFDGTRIRRIPPNNN